jgi:hypothetical protein
MATQENSVQFSLKELVQLESNRRSDEVALAKQRAEEEARRSAEAEAKARQLRVQAEAKQAAEIAAQQAREEAEQMLATERAKIAREDASYVAPQVTQTRSNAWMGLAAMFLSVVGLGTSLFYIASQPTSAAVRLSQQPIEITKIEQLAAPIDPVVKVLPETKPEIKVVKKDPKKDPKDTKPTCDYKKDPTCGINSTRD